MLGYPALSALSLEPQQLAQLAVLLVLLPLLPLWALLLFPHCWGLALWLALPPSPDRIPAALAVLGPLLPPACLLLRRLAAHAWPAVHPVPPQLSCC